MVLTIRFLAYFHDKTSTFHRTATSSFNVFITSCVNLATDGEDVSWSGIYGTFSSSLGGSYYML